MDISTKNVSTLISHDNYRINTISKNFKNLNKLTKTVFKDKYISSFESDKDKDLRKIKIISKRKVFF